MKHLRIPGNKGIYGNTGRGMEINGYSLNIDKNKKGSSPHIVTIKRVIAEYCDR